MKFFAIEKGNANSPGLFSDELLREEAFKVHQLYLAGILREIYFNDDHCAVLMLECSGRQMAVDTIAGLPLVQNGLIRFDLMELKPYTGYERIIQRG
jgi:hypothetical protein